MMIKGSLLRSIPIVKRFSASENRAKNWGLGVQKGKSFIPNNQTPPPQEINLNRNTLSGAKSVSIDAKMWSPEVGKKFQKNKERTEFDIHISALCRVGPAGPIFTLCGMWGHMADVITHVKF